MLLILSTLIVMLQGLGITEYLLNFGEKDEFPVDEDLFQIDSGINRFMFTKITFFLFSLLDRDKANEYFGGLTPVENPDDYKVFNTRTVRWLKDLSHTSKLLRYVPLSIKVFNDCSGPLMHQVMFAFTMAVVKNTVFDKGVTTLMGEKSKFDRGSYDAHVKLFIDMATDKNNINRKSFEADLFGHLLTRVYGKKSKETVLKSHPRPVRNVRRSAMVSQQNASNHGYADSVASASNEHSPTQEGSLNRLDTAYPLNHRGRRVPIKRPFFRQKSPLNENGALKPVPTPSIWDLDLSAHNKKRKSPAMRLKKYQRHKIRQAIEEQCLAYERMEAERMEAIRKAEEQRLAAEMKERERKSAAKKKANERRSAAKKKVREQRVEARKKAEQRRLAARRKAEEQRSAIKEKARERRSKARKKARGQRATVERKEREQKLAAEKNGREQKEAVERKERERRAAVERKKGDQRLATEKKEQEERGKVAQLDQENCRGTKRKSEEVQKNATSTKRSKRVPLRKLC